MHSEKTPVESPFNIPGIGSQRHKRLSSEELFDTSKIVLISHCGEEYRLCITGKGKLILIK
jgi:hemin uptake protein HemP